MSICFLVVCGWKVIHRTPQDSWVRTLAFPSLYECAGHGLATMMERTAGAAEDQRRKWRGGVFPAKARRRLHRQMPIWEWMTWRRRFVGGVP